MLKNSDGGNGTMITGRCGLLPWFDTVSIECSNGVHDVIQPDVELLKAVVDSGKLIAKTLDRVLQFGSMSAELVYSIGEIACRIVVIVLVAAVVDGIRVWGLRTDLNRLLHVSPGAWSTGCRSRRVWCRFGYCGALLGWHDVAEL